MSTKPIKADVTIMAPQIIDGETGEIVSTGETAIEAVPVDGEITQLLHQNFNAAQVDFLLQRTPPKAVKQRKGRGGQMFPYVDIGYVTSRLNLVFGFNWDFEVLSKEIVGDEAIVEGRLTVRTVGGQTIVKEQFGGVDIEYYSTGHPKAGRPLSIADNYKGAASDALKKCASLLGIGGDVYGQEANVAMLAEAEREASGEPRPSPRQRVEARAASQSHPVPEPSGGDLFDGEPAGGAPPDEWAAFGGNAVKHLNKIGCSDQLINETLDQIWSIAQKQGKTADIEWLRSVYRALRSCGVIAELNIWRKTLPGGITLPVKPAEEAAV